MPDMMDVIAANPGMARPAPSELTTEEGGVIVADTPSQAAQIAQRAEDAATPAPDLTAALTAALQNLAKKNEPSQVLGERLPVEGEDGRIPVAEPVADATAAPQAADPAAPAPTQQQAPQAPQSQDYMALTEQLVQANLRLAQAELAAQRLAQIEPHYNAVMQRMPEMQGIQAKLAEANDKLLYNEAKNKYVVDAYAAGTPPDVAAFENQWKLNRVLERAANIDKVVEDKFGAMLNDRDSRWQASQQQQQAQQFQQNTINTFDQAWNAATTKYPHLKTLKSHDLIRQTVGNQWFEASKAANQYLPVERFLEPFVQDFRAQAVAAQAPVLTRAEQQARMPVTNRGGSGASTPTGPTRPAGYSKWGLKERLAYDFKNSSVGR